MQHPDVVIAGAGVTGLSLALELQRRGYRVRVLDRNTPGLASRAAAGMLAAHDPHNPRHLQPLANLALELYPEYLHRIREGSAQPVPIQTTHVLEPGPNGTPGPELLPALAPAAGRFLLRAEQSLDPRDLHAALRAAAQQAGIAIEAQASPDLPTSTAQPFVDCTGAWSPTHTQPAKGQMLRVKLPPELLRLRDGGNAVVRTGHIYIVPRLDGSALIGATVEDAGFDLTMHDDALRGLRNLAAELLPAVMQAPEVERWSGLRPRTADDLPILGQVAPNRYVANGLFRNGILLAPAVAQVMAELLTGRPPSVSLAPFSPARFLPAPL